MTALNEIEEDLKWIRNKAVEEELSTHIEVTFDEPNLCLNVLDKALAQLAALREEMQWRDISAAPKDGTVVLAIVNDWYENKVRYELLQFSINGYWQSAYHGNQTYDLEDIKGWQMLQAAQTTEKPNDKT